MAAAQDDNSRHGKASRSDIVGSAVGWVERAVDLNCCKLDVCFVHCCMQSCAILKKQFGSDIGAVLALT